MRYKAGYKQEKRKQLLHISGQIAKKQGFHSTGVDTFMQAAGMTSGAFYSHFSSKQDLLNALIEAELQHSLTMWQNNPYTQAEQWMEFELDRYLSFSHVQHAEHGCMLPALATEIARSDIHIQQCYQQELVKGHQIFAQHLHSEEMAWAVMCQLVGTILIARSVENEALKKMILESNKQNIRFMLKQSLTSN